MKKLIGALFSIALAVAVTLPAAAATKGGKLVYARYADSLWEPASANGATRFKIVPSCVKRMP